MVFDEFQSALSRQSDYELMKTICASFLFAFTLATTHAQEELYLPTTDAGCYIPAVVYNSVVVYNGPVVYYAPVVYNGPVFYGAQFADPCPPSQCEPEAPSIVIHIGGGQSYTTANYGDYAPTVIHFGGRQAVAQGYHFGHR